MKIRSSLAAGLSLSLLWMLTGCESRSISDSGYHHGSHAWGDVYANNGGGYRG